MDDRRRRPGRRLGARGWSFATAVVLSLVVFPIVAAAADLDLDTADGPRHALVVRSSDSPRPTVVVLHGALGTGSFVLRTSGFGEAAARYGFNAVFPDGLDRRWNDRRQGGLGGPDDVAYLRALVARLLADRVARPGQVYLAGISNGGMMAMTMACTEGRLFAGLGTIIASMPAGLASCPLRAMPVVMIDGTADPMVPYRGGGVGLGGERGTVLGVERTAALYASANGCRDGPVSTALPKKDASAATSVVRLEWIGCTRGASSTLYRMDGGGHGVPGHASRLPLLGPVNLDFDAADVIMATFAAH